MESRKERKKCSSNFRYYIFGVEFVWFEDFVSVRGAELSVYQVKVKSVK